MIRVLFHRLFGTGRNGSDASHLRLVGRNAPAKRSAVAATTPSRPRLPIFGKSRCDWVMDGQKNASFTQFRCQTCGVEAFSRNGKAPRQCKRGVEGGL